ncbi:pyrroline-5-carboxylate reductase [Sutcliffiella cohnii]
MKIAFLGAGSMAEAIISGLIKRGIANPSDISVTNRQDVERLNLIARIYGVTTETNKEKAVSEANVVFLAIKPKDAKEALQSIASYVNNDTLIISVLAGVSIESIQQLLQKEVRVIRAMPNTSATVGLSATAISVGENVTEDEYEFARTLFSAIGSCSIVKEDQLHAVTGLSGSGPAYVYYVAEALEKAALEQGLEHEVAKKLIQQTLLGAAEMLGRTKKEPAQLRREVTSPGGTTEAGISILQQSETAEAIQACVKRATERSRELGDMLMRELEDTKI